MTPTQYEMATLERFRTLFPPPHFKVCHNIKLAGRKSRKLRQIDVAVFGTGKSEPILIAESKRHSRAIDVAKAGMTIALVRDVGKIPAIMVASSGFSLAAESYLGAEEIDTLVISLDEAEALRWIPEIEKQFAVDHAFREIAGSFVEAVSNNDASVFLDELLPYEEWLAVIAVGRLKFPKSTMKVLRLIAKRHRDSGVRFNAIQLISQDGPLTASFIAKLRATESDPEVLELIQELVA